VGVKPTGRIAERSNIIIQDTKLSAYIITETKLVELGKVVVI